MKKEKVGATPARPAVPNRAEPIHSVKGTRDLLPRETALWQRVEDEARRVFGAYNFREIRTPVLEQTALFARSVGADTDIVTKEMYAFQSEDVEEGFAGFIKKSVCLRPEATASVVRAYIEHSMANEGGIHKLYYIGPMFRRERPQKGRYRQFYQIGAEVLGSDHPTIDAEFLEMLALLLNRVGITEYQLLLNSVGCPNCRPAFVETLRQALENVKDQMCGDCQRRAETNPLRVLDCKVEADQPIIAKLPHIIEHLCAECRDHFDRVTKELDERSIPYQITPRLVRGLDYYTRTTFEMTSGVLGAQNAFLGGGRYDGLSEMLGGPPTPGFGVAIGEDRLLDIVKQAGKLSADERLDVFVAWLGEAAAKPAARLVKELREQGLRVESNYESAKLKKTLAQANKLGARFAVIIGEGELVSGRYQVKDMSAARQEEVAADQVTKFLKSKIVRS